MWMARSPSLYNCTWDTKNHWGSPSSYQHESDEEAIPPVWSVQDISHQDTGSVTQPLLQQKVDKTRQFWNFRQILHKWNQLSPFETWFPGAWVHFSLVLLNHVRLFALASTCFGCVLNWKLNDTKIKLFFATFFSWKIAQNSTDMRLAASPI